MYVPNADIGPPRVRAHANDGWDVVWLFPLSVETAASHTIGCMRKFTT
jgi:hypothetical protein